MQANRQQWPSVTEVAFEEEEVVAEAVTEEVVEAEGACILFYSARSRYAKIVLQYYVRAHCSLAPQSFTSQYSYYKVFCKSAAS